MNTQYFGPSGYENFFVLRCENIVGFEEARLQLIRDLKERAFGLESSYLYSRELYAVFTSESAKGRDSLRPNLPREENNISTMNCLVVFPKEPVIEIWRGYQSERACMLVARVLSSFIMSNDVIIVSDHGDNLTEHYRRYPWELLLGR